MIGHYLEAPVYISYVNSPIRNPIIGPRGLVNLKFSGRAGLKHSKAGIRKGTSGDVKLKVVAIVTIPDPFPNHVDITPKGRLQNSPQ